MSNLEKGLQAFANQNYSETLALLKPLAEQGNAEAQCIIGNLYHLGLGIDQNIKEAIKWYLKSAQQGYPIAINNFKTICIMENIGKRYKISNEMNFIASRLDV
jgi:TPR repeat protein